VDVFPEGEQDHIRVQLAGSLIAVQSQTLCETADQRGVVAAYELMIVNDAVRASILKDRPVGVDDAIRGGKNLGMRLRDDHLIELASSGKITRQMAISKSRDASYVNAELAKRPM
jgi:twitching motility protein PilT